MSSAFEHNVMQDDRLASGLSTLPSSGSYQPNGIELPSSIQYYSRRANMAQASPRRNEGSTTLNEQYPSAISDRVQDILAELDFGSVLPLAEEESAPRTPAISSQLLWNLEHNAREGHFAAFRAEYHAADGLPGTSADRQIFSPSLLIAIEHRNKDIAVFLLAEGVTAGLSHVKMATRNKDVGILESLLLHGWGINTPLEWSVPPALA